MPGPDAFGAALAALLVQEGGFVNDPRDPGGITNLGVTKAAWEAYQHHPVSEADMRALTRAVVAPFYRVNYWMPIAGDALPAGLSLCAFDFAVNGGVARAARYVQQLVGSVQDGHIGPGTLAALQQWVTAHSLAEAVRQYMNLRRTFYRGNPKFDVFGRGWLNRCDAIETAALKQLP